jgi:H+/Cl- antiporter ClcA
VAAEVDDVSAPPPDPLGPDDALLQALSDWRAWAARLVIIGFAVLSGLAVIGLTWLSEIALRTFFSVHAAQPWLVLLWTPTLTAAIVWLTRRWAPGAAGSGIPQVLAAQHEEVAPEQRKHLVSLKLSLAKVLLTSGGLLAGLSTGREGPSVQVAAGVMHHARRWLPQRSHVNERGLLVAGGAAGVAAAFNTPLGGVVFAIEQLSRRPEDRASGLLIAAIVIAGLVAVSAFGSGTYFGRIQVEAMGWSLLWPGLAVALACGVAGGLFSRLLTWSLSPGTDRFRRFRQARPCLFAAACGLAVAAIGLLSSGQSFGSGYQATRQMLEGQDSTQGLDTALRFLATWLSAICGVPGGIFAPSLTMGASIGHEVASLTSDPKPVLIAIGMAAFLAAVTQAPLTAFIIVMEMVDGHAMVLSLMGAAMLAATVSRLIARPLYETVMRQMVDQLGAQNKEAFTPVNASSSRPPGGDPGPTQSAQR